MAMAPWRFIVPLRGIDPVFMGWVFEATLGLVAVDPVTLRITSTREELGRAHDEWAKSVAAAVPSNRLLIHKASDGWAPICQRLRLPAPAEPYPHLNDAKAMGRVIDAAEIGATVWWPAVGVAIALTLFAP